MDLTAHIKRRHPWLTERTASIDIERPPATSGVNPSIVTIGGETSLDTTLSDYLAQNSTLQAVDRVAVRADALLKNDPEAYRRRQAELDSARGNFLFRHIHERLTKETRGTISTVGIDRLSYDLYSAAKDTAYGSWDNIKEAWTASGDTPPEGRWQSALNAFLRAWNHPERSITSILMAGVTFVADLIAPGFTGNLTQLAANDVAGRTMTSLERDGLAGKDLVMMGHLIEKGALAQAGIKSDSTGILDYAIKNRDAGRLLQEQTPPPPSRIASFLAPVLPAMAATVPLAVPVEKYALVGQPDAASALRQTLLATRIIGGTAPYNDPAIRRQLVSPEALAAQEKLSAGIIARLIEKQDNPVFDAVRATIRAQVKSDAEAEAYLRDPRLRLVLANQMNGPATATTLMLPAPPGGKAPLSISLARAEFQDPAQWAAGHDRSLHSLVGSVPAAARRMDPRERDWDARFGGPAQWARENGRAEGINLRPTTKTLEDYRDDMRRRLSNGSGPAGFKAEALVSPELREMRERLSNREAVDFVGQLKQHNQSASTPVVLPAELQARLEKKGGLDHASNVGIAELHPYLAQLGNPALDTPKSFIEARTRYTLEELKARRALLGDDAASSSGLGHAVAVLPEKGRAMVNALNRKWFGGTIDTPSTLPDPALPAVTGSTATLASERARFNDAIAQAEKSGRSAESTLTSVAIDSPERVARIVAAAQDSLDRLGFKEKSLPAPGPAALPVTVRQAPSGMDALLTGFQPSASAIETGDAAQAAPLPTPGTASGGGGTRVAGR